MLDIFDILGKIKFRITNSTQLDGGIWALADQHEFDISIQSNIKDGQNRHKVSGGDAYCFPIDNYQHGADLIDELSDHLNLKKQDVFIDAKSGITLSQDKNLFLFIVVKEKEHSLPKVY